MAKKDFDKVKCQYCGKEFSKAGIANHEKACSENPENKVERNCSRARSNSRGQY